VVPYLARVSDPYCITSRNAKWDKAYSLKEWISALKVNGYTVSPADGSVFEFSQPSRVQNYVTGNFSVPLRTLRENLGLRSTYFSVSTSGDSVVLKGKGYGHGVGLCQEGAMVMANRGFTFSQIIDFYYKGVIIINISSAKKTGNEKEGL
jgi:stage II sporulation protein D